LQREQQKAAHDGEVLVEMCHVAAARSPLHVPEIMSEEDNEDEVDDERVGNLTGLEADQDCKPADQLDRRDVFRGRLNDAEFEASERKLAEFINVRATSKQHLAIETKVEMVVRLTGDAV
jgi:hypothetical protein